MGNRVGFYAIAFEGIQDDCLEISLEQAFVGLDLPKLTDHAAMLETPFSITLYVT